MLEERALPLGVVSAFATQRRQPLRFRGAPLDVQPASEDALRPFDVVFFAGGEDASERFAPALIERGAVVIDNSPAFRMRDDVPLIVPEINGDVLRPGHRLLPVANCTAIVLCTALAPIRDAAGLQSVQVATYQAASGAGRPGLEELLAGERAAVAGEEAPPARTFPKPLARNVVPQVGTLDAGGESGEERKIREETRKMLGLPDLFVGACAVRVPVLRAHAAAVFVQTQRSTTVTALAEQFETASGVRFWRDGIVTPRDAEGGDDVHVARLRAQEPEPATHFALWCVGDQLRKGAATNAVQILQLLLERGFVRA